MRAHFNNESLGVEKNHREFLRVVKVLFPHKSQNMIDNTVRRSGKRENKFSFTESFGKKENLDYKKITLSYFPKKNQFEVEISIPADKTGVVFLSQKIVFCAENLDLAFALKIVKEYQEDGKILALLSEKAENAMA